jgi:hypothetical protein
MHLTLFLKITSSIAIARLHTTFYFEKSDVFRWLVVNLGLSPTRQGICSFASGTTLCSLGSLSNREGRPRCIFASPLSLKASAREREGRMPAARGRGARGGGETARPPGKDARRGEPPEMEGPGDLRAMTTTLGRRRREGRGASAVGEERRGGGSGPTPCTSCSAACEIRRRMSSFTACEIRRELFLLPHLRVAHLRRRWRPHGSLVRKSSGGGRKSTIDMVRTAGLLPLGGPRLDLRVVDDDDGSTAASSSPPAGATSSELEGRSLYTTGSASTAATSPGCAARACRRRSINGGWDWDSRGRQKEGFCIRL